MIQIIESVEDAAIIEEDVDTEMRELIDCGQDETGTSIPSFSVERRTSPDDHRSRIVELVTSRNGRGSLVFARTRLFAGLVVIVALLLSILFVTSFVSKSPSDAQQHQQQFTGTQEQPPSMPSYFYYNLSCPLEWSKYSCIHHGHKERAQHSLDQVRVHKNAITDIFQSGLLPYSRLLLVGDSTMRQLIISMGCIALALDSNVKYAVDWQDDWPCHGTPNCVPGGPHSGFSHASLQFPNGAQVHFIALGGSNYINCETDIVQRFTNQLANEGRITFGSNNTAIPIAPADSILNATDTLIFNIGLHNKASKIRPTLQAFIDFSDQLRRHPDRPQIVYITSITQHFRTPNGQYDKKLLAKQTQDENACLPTLDHNPRAQMEQEMVTEHVDHLIDYNDLENGACHIGGEDCTHYCMPGPPDWMAARLLQAVQTLQSRQS